MYLFWDLTTKNSSIFMEKVHNVLIMVILIVIYFLLWITYMPYCISNIAFLIKYLMTINSLWKIDVIFNCSIYNSWLCSSKNFWEDVHLYVLDDSKKVELRVFCINVKLSSQYIKDIWDICTFSKIGTSLHSAIFVHVSKHPHCMRLDYKTRKNHIILVNVSKHLPRHSNNLIQRNSQTLLQCALMKNVLAPKY